MCNRCAGVTRPAVNALEERAIARGADMYIIMSGDGGRRGIMQLTLRLKESKPREKRREDIYIF